MQVVSQINTLPYEVSHANRYHPTLYRTISSPFSDFEQIQANIDILNEELTKKLLDPLQEYPFDRFISLSDTTNTSKTLARFQGTYEIKDSVSLIKKCTKKTMVLYTQLENHPDIDEYYIAYIDRRTLLFFKAVLQYIECLETP
jgi:hypothetical protein